MQKRNRNKKTYAGSWSVTGGHTLAGENKEEAIIREIKEEINLDVKNKDIEEIITYYSARINDIIINNKFITIFLIKILKEDINKIIIQKDELEEIKFITVNDLERLIAKEENGYKFPQKMELVVEKLKKRCENNDNNI